jgi:hypothetical protein
MQEQVFLSQSLRKYILNRSDEEAINSIPQFARPIATGLMLQAARIEFHVQDLFDDEREGPCTSHGEMRPMDEFHALLRFMSNGLLRWKELGLPFDGTEVCDLANDTYDDDDRSPCGAALGFIEAWPEMATPRQSKGTSALSPHLNDDDAEIDGFTSVKATIGNVAAAVGILKLDRAIVYWEQKLLDEAMIQLSWAAQFLAAAVEANSADTILFFERASKRNQASARAKKMHQSSPAAEGKQKVHEWWLTWKSNPDMYESTASFSRAMLDKYPDHLRSEVVIGRWVTAWSKAL